MGSAAVLTVAEAAEKEARELTGNLWRHNDWEERFRAEDRIEELHETARSIRQRIESSREHIRNYYGLNLHVGLGVKHGGKLGRIVGFADQYVVVQLDGEEHDTVCHATSSMEYPPGVQVGPGPDERFAHLVEG